MSGSIKGGSYVRPNAACNESENNKADPTFIRRRGDADTAEIPTHISQLVVVPLFEYYVWCMESSRCCGPPPFPHDTNILIYMYMCVCIYRKSAVYSVQRDRCCMLRRPTFPGCYRSSNFELVTNQLTSHTCFICFIFQNWCCREERVA